MKIITAIDNVVLKEKLDEVYSDEVYKYDINYMEGVIEYLSKNENNDKRVLITKDNLNGKLTNITYIKQIKLADPNIKVVLFISNLTKEYKEFLFANEIFNIIESDNITLEELKECIESDKSVIYKNIVTSNKENSITIKNNIITKQLIAVFGTSGAGKSYIASAFSQDISKKLDINVALLDMDLQNSAIDIFNDLNNTDNVLEKVIQDIDKNKDTNLSIKNNMINDNKNKKISYLTNSCSIYDYQNKFSTDYYQKIYSACQNIYDYIVVDLPASLFIDVVSFSLIKASKILFVINPNYISLRQAIKYLDIINKVFEISKDNIFIIVNKIQKDSLDINQIESILNGYNVISSIDYDYFIEGYINGSCSYTKNNIDFSKLYKILNLNIDNKNKFNKKIIFSDIITNLKSKKVQNFDNKSI